MYQEKRPTCVTVIGWVWIILGGFMCLSAVMGYLNSLRIKQVLESCQRIGLGTATGARSFPLFPLGQIGLAAVGIVAGINFLRLKYWGRHVLEVITWLLLLFVVGFGVLSISSLCSRTPEDDPFGVAVFGIVKAVVILGIYAAALGIMIKYLRGPKVKNAMSGTAEPSAPPDKQ